MREGDQAHIAASELGVERLQRELTTLIDLEVAQRGSPLAAEHLPGNDVRVVLHLGDQHHIAGVHVGPTPGVGDQVDRLGDVLREDRRLRFASDEGCDLAPRCLVGRIGLLGERVDAAVHVRVMALQVIGERVDHDLRLLRCRA